MSPYNIRNDFDECNTVCVQRVGLQPQNKLLEITESGLHRATTSHCFLLGRQLDAGERSPEGGSWVGSAEAVKLSDRLFQFVSVENVIESSPVARAGWGLRGLSEPLLC